MVLMIGTTVAAAPAPKPPAVKPAASPRRSANHFSALPTQVPYTQPAPMPDMIAATYSMGSDVATLFRPQPMATITPPIMTTTFGPNLSTNQPSIGISQVSASTKTLNATWIAARLQPFASFMGLT